MWNFRPQSSNRWPPSLAVLRTQHFLKTDWRKVGDSALLRKNRTVIRTLSRIQQPKLLISNFFIIIYLFIYLVIYCSHKDEFHKVQMASFLMSAKLSLLLSTGTTVDVQTMSYFLCFWRFLFLFQCVIYLFFKKKQSQFHPPGHFFIILCDMVHINSMLNCCTDISQTVRMLHIYILFF